MVEKDLTVLVIDDESLILTLVNSFLRKSRFLPFLAGDMVQARRIVLESERGIDIVLADVTLPIRGRDEFWAVLQDRFPGARVVHMSGFPEDQADLPHWAGPRFFLQKPFKGAELLSILERASQAMRSAGGF